MHDPFIGKVLDGRYEILARIGEGGMGVVYKARQVSIDRVIAIKVLNPQMASDQQWVHRFSNEARACSRLQHPNTIRMFDFGQTSEGRYFLTMEFLEGSVLRQVIEQGPMQPHRVIKILIQCCASLAEAHSIGIIHRDIKPDNVFILNMAGSPDFVKLLDFSVAKLLQENSMKTQAGVVFGTPQYMSPEQGRGLPLDARSDLYALGILGYEMLTGRTPFNDDNPMTVLQMHLRSEVPPMPPNVPPNVQAVVRKALEKDPSRRYQSAGEMMGHCQQVFAELNQGQSIGGGGVPKTMIAQPGPGMPGGPPLPHGMVQPALGGQQMGGHGPPQGYPPQQGAGAQQKTMMAGMPPQGYPGGPSPTAPPQGHGPPPPQPAYQSATPAQKTMMAMSPVSIPGHPGHQQQMPGGPPPAAGGPPPGMSTLPGQGMPPPGMHGMPGMPPQGMPGMPPGQGMHGMPPGQGMHGMPPGMGGGPGMRPQGGPPGGSQPQKTMMLQDSEGVVSVAQRGPIPQGGHAGFAPAPTAGGASAMFWILSLLIGVAVGALAYIIVLQL